MRNFLEQQESFEVLAVQYPSPTSYVSESLSDCFDNMDGPFFDSQVSPNLWNEKSWRLSDSTDEASEVFPLNPPQWQLNFPGSMSDMTMGMSAHAIGASSTVASHPTSATAPDEMWTMDPKINMLTRLLEDQFEQPGQGQDPSGQFQDPNDEQEDGEEEEGEEEDEDDADLDDDDSGLYQEHHAEIEQEVSRERSDSATRNLKGNNPYGSRGCESCMACRRRKGKVFPPRSSWLIEVRVHKQRSCLRILCSHESSMRSQSH
jgi:hypothetical protein